MHSFHPTKTSDRTDWHKTNKQTKQHNKTHPKNPHPPLLFCGQQNGNTITDGEGFFILNGLRKGSGKANERNDKAHGCQTGRENAYNANERTNALARKLTSTVKNDFVVVVCYRGKKHVNEKLNCIGTQIVRDFMYNLYLLFAWYKGFPYNSTSSFYKLLQSYEQYIIIQSIKHLPIPTYHFGETQFYHTRYFLYRDDRNY